MLTNEDINKIVEAQKEVFPTKQDFECFKDETKKDFSDLQTSVDSYAKKADGYFQEKKIDFLFEIWYTFL